VGGVNDSPVAVIRRACVMRRDFVTAPGPRWKSAHFRLITDKASKEHDIFAVLLTSRPLKPPIESRAPAWGRKKTVGTFVGTVSLGINARSRMKSTKPAPAKDSIHIERYCAILLKKRSQRLGCVWSPVQIRPPRSIEIEGSWLNK
jgi:hypothetical protein